MDIPVHQCISRSDDPDQLPVFCFQEPILAARVYIPWSKELIKSDRFAAALQALKRAGRPDLAYVLLLELLDNCVTQRRFREASRWCWTCAREILKHASSCPTPQSSHYGPAGPSNLPDTHALYFYFCFRRLGEIYLAYHVVVRRDEGIFPFWVAPQPTESKTTLQDIVVFDAAAFLWNYILASPPGTSGDPGRTADRFERPSAPGCTHDWRGARTGCRFERARPSWEWPSSLAKLAPWSGRGHGEFGRALNEWANRFDTAILPGISQAVVLHALAESSLRLKAYKVRRLERSLQSARVPLLLSSIHRDCKPCICVCVLVDWPIGMSKASATANPRWAAKSRGLPFAEAAVENLLG